MDTKLDSIKEKIEEMRRTRVPRTGELIGKVAKRNSRSAWADSSVEALINTTLAMRQRWEETAEPRSKAFKRNWPNVKTIYDLKRLLKSMDEYEFCDKVLGMKIKKTPNWRYEMLKDMVNAFIQYQKEKGFESDLDAMKDWAQNCDISNWENDTVGKLRNVGLATFQNLRICLGIKTIKPDVHVKNTLKEIGLGSEVQVTELISELTGYSPLELDQIFWYWDKI